MLEIQKYLLSGKTTLNLNEELGINAAIHPHLPLVILNYDQIDSPKTHPIVREARGLVLNSQDWSVVARSFPRFFNWGEVQDEMGLFDFSDFIVQSKEDGSLVIIYYYDGSWHANTKGSFAIDNMQFQEFTWRDAFCQGLKINSLNDLDSKLDRNISYVCEFVSPWNKVVRRYDNPHLYLLTAFQGLNEIHHQQVDSMTSGLFSRPQKYNFSSVEEIQQFLRDQASNDPTFEGVVICDHQGRRWKIKSATYLGLHRLRGEGDNMYNPKHLLPFVIANESDELLTYFPEVTEAYLKLKEKVENYYNSLLELWLEHHNIESQKDFALKVKDHRFSSILFQVRKEHGSNQTEKEVRKKFLESESLILKNL